MLTQNPMNGKQYELVFIIVNKGLKPLLGAPSIQMLNLMSINNQNVMSPDTSSHTTPKAEDILMRYTNVFIGDGKLQEELHLEVNRHGQTFPSERHQSLLKKPWQTTTGNYTPSYNAVGRRVLS